MNYKFFNALKNGDLEVIKECLDQGTDINIRDNLNNAPLHLAIKKNKNEIIRNYLNFNPNANLEPASLIVAAEKRNLEIIRELLDRGANVNARDSLDQTPLHLTSEKNNLELVNELLNKGADIHIKDAWDFTLLHLAATKNNLELVKKCLAFGLDINARDYKNSTPLHFATLYNNLEIVIELVNNGADVKLRNIDTTPIGITIQKDNEEIFKILATKISANDFEMQINLCKNHNINKLNYQIEEKFRNLYKEVYTKNKSQKNKQTIDWKRTTFIKPTVFSPVTKIQSGGQLKNAKLMSKHFILNNDSKTRDRYKTEIKDYSKVNLDKIQNIRYSKK